MRIIELTLHRYTRLAFSAIETIHYKPTETTQIIIGTNGSGKSSFLNELNPIPPNKNYMLDGGYKKIRIEHKGVEYTLLSTYGKHNKHSFIEHRTEAGDLELNEGGTGVAQKILIEKIFGLNFELLKIWLGRVRFTELAPIKRRDWILRLSGSDLDFAMRVFQAVKNETRDAQALEKHFIKRLADEAADMADKNRIEELEDAVARITLQLNHLLEQKDNSVPSVAFVRTEIDKLIREFHECADIALGVQLYKPDFIPFEIDNVEALEYYISNEKTRVEMLREKLNEYYDQKKTVNEALEALSTNGVNSTNELEALTQQFRLEKDALIASTPIYDEVKNTDVGQLLGRYHASRGLLMETLGVLPDNSDGYYSKDKLAKAREKTILIEQRISAAKQRDYQLSHSIEHYKSLNDETCPNCTFSFKPGMHNYDLEATQREIERIREAIVADEAVLVKGREYIEGANEYIRAIGALKRIISDNPELEPLWNMLLKENLYRVAPQSHLPTVVAFQSLLENALGIQTLEEQIRVNETVLASIKNATDGQATYTDSYAQMLDARISETITLIDNIKHTVSGCIKYLKQIEHRNAAVLRALEIRNTLAEKHDVLIRSGLNRIVGEMVQTKQVELANVNTALNKITRHDAVIQEITQQKNDATDRLNKYNIIMKALSPTEGLISKYIQNFLDVFIEDVNLVIDEIWTSPLEVLSCGVDSSEVTCKFPLSVNDGYLVTPDINEASDGQKDIIDFAFRMVVGQYLGLNDYPLYLDELAPTLDEQHRENLTRYVNNLMETNQFEQMFMISHYANNHYAFANSEILMMDGRNIINKPGNFNKHVKIVYSADIVPKEKLAA